MILIFILFYMQPVTTVFIQTAQRHISSVKHGLPIFFAVCILIRRNTGFIGWGDSFEMTYLYHIHVHIKDCRVKGG